MLRGHPSMNTVAAVFTVGLTVGHMYSVDVCTVLELHVQE